jgi:hypothetical protein
MAVIPARAITGRISDKAGRKGRSRPIWRLRSARTTTITAMGIHWL